MLKRERNKKKNRNYWMWWSRRNKNPFSFHVRIHCALGGRKVLDFTSVTERYWCALRIRRIVSSPVHVYGCVCAQIDANITFIHIPTQDPYAAMNGNLLQSESNANERTKRKKRNNNVAFCVEQRPKWVNTCLAEWHENKRTANQTYRRDRYHRILVE